MSGWHLCDLEGVPKGKCSQFQTCRSLNTSCNRSKACMYRSMSSKFLYTSRSRECHTMKNWQGLTMSLSWEKSDAVDNLTHVSFPTHVSAGNNDAMSLTHGPKYKPKLRIRYDYGQSLMYLIISIHCWERVLCVSQQYRNSADVDGPEMQWALSVPVGKRNSIERNAWDAVP